MFSRSGRYFLIAALLALGVAVTWGQRWLDSRPLTPVPAAAGGERALGHIYFVDVEGWYRVTPYEAAVSSPYDLSADTNDTMSRTLPGVLGEWRQAGQDLDLSGDPIVVEYLAHPMLAWQRNYEDAAGQRLALIVIGNRGDASFSLFSHTPEICYPGNLWHLLENRRDSAPLGDGRMHARYLLVEHAETGERVVVLYWYLWNNAQRDARDGVWSMRINVYLLPGQSEAAGLARAWDFVRMLFSDTVVWERF